jgi:Tfp pilus assembly PilM family ATPase
MSTTSISTSLRRRLAGLKRQPRGRLGIEISHSHLRLAREIESGGLVKWETGELPIPLDFYDGSKAAGKSLRKQLGQIGFNPGEAIGILVSTEIDAFPLTLSARSEGEVEKQIVAQAGDHLSYPLQEAVLDFIDIPDEMRRPDDKSNAVLVYAVPRALTERISETFEQAGFLLDTLVTPACVLADPIKQIAGEKRYMVIAPLEEATMVAIIQDGNILLERFLAWNIGLLVERLQRELELSVPQCHALMGISVNDEVGDNTPQRMPAPLRDILSPSLHYLAQEAMSCVGYCNSLLQSKPVSEILLLGPLASRPFLRDSLLQLLDLPLVDISQLPCTPGGAQFVAAACTTRLSETKTGGGND